MAYSYSWYDLTSKSDIFSTLLPQYVDGELQENYSFKFNVDSNKAKYSFLLNHTNGERGKVEFSGNETYTNYYDTNLGFKVNSKPGVELSARFTDKLIPLEGSTLSVKLLADGHDENLVTAFHYVNKNVNGRLGLILPLHHKIFDLSLFKESEPRTTVVGDVLVRPFDDQDIYVGVNGSLEVPLEHETLHYDVKTVLATKNADFEGGVYARKGLIRKVDNEKEEKTKVGVWSTTSGDSFVAGAHASYDLNKKEEEYKGFNFEGYASFPSGNDTKYLGSVQIIPNTTLSLGLEKRINSQTKISFGVAYVVAAGKHFKAEKAKKTAFSFALELDS